MAPTIGRIVIVTLSDTGEQRPAIIHRVWSESCINVTTFSDSGTAVLTSVVKNGAAQGAYATWDWPARV